MRVGERALGKAAPCVKRCQPELTEQRCADKHAQPLAHGEQLDDPLLRRSASCGQRAQRARNHHHHHAPPSNVGHIRGRGGRKIPPIPYMTLLYAQSQEDFTIEGTIGWRACPLHHLAQSSLLRQMCAEHMVFEEMSKARRLCAFPTSTGGGSSRTTRGAWAAMTMVDNGRQ